jgi:hypothetical protein
LWQELWKIVRKIYGPVKEREWYRIRPNKEIKNILQWNINIVNYIKVKRLAWAGYLMRMNDDRTIKKIFNTKPDGTRRAGRPKI